MNKPIHQFSELFAQLGLPNDNHSIAHFLINHASMADSERLPDAPYWTLSQAAFLRESLTHDSDWTGLVDQLSAALRQPEEAMGDRTTGDQILTIIGKERSPMASLPGAKIPAAIQFNQESKPC
jgi:hypothetical protein